MSNTSSNKTSKTNQQTVKVIVGEIGRDTKTGVLGRGYSYDNGATFHVTDTMFGRLYDKDDGERMWPNMAHKVADEIKSATADLPNVRKQADEAVKFAESAIAASKVNSDAIVAQSSAVVEAKSAMDSATAEIQQLKANAASDVAQIRADVAQVQNEVDTAKDTNSASVDKLKSDIGLAQKDLDNVHDSLTKARSAVEQNQKLINDSVAKINSDIAQNRQDIVTAQQANDDLAKQLDTYSKEAQEQGKTIKTIQDNQDGFSITIADVKGDVTKVSDTVDSLSAGLKDAQGNIASVKAQADQLNAILTDHSKDIAQLTATAKELSSTLEDANGRLSKVEQTASEQSTTLSDLQGNLTQVKQTADSLVTTLKDAQGNIDQIKQDAKGTLEQLSNAQGDITALQKDVSGIKLTIADHDKNIHTLQADSKTLKDDMADAKGNISSLQKTSTSLVSEFRDHDGRLSKVEQTATEHTSELADTKGNIDSLKQRADSLQVLLGTAQQDINNIKINASGLDAKLTTQGNDINQIKANAAGMSTRLSGVETAGNQLRDQLNGLKIGTSNLLHHSDTFDGWDKGNLVTITSDKYLNGTIAVLGNTGIAGGSQIDTHLDGPYDNQPVTWTVYAKADNVGDKLHTELWGGGGYTDQPLTNNWQIYQFTGQRNINHPDFYLWGCQGNKGNIYVALPFAVVGNTIGTWSPNSDDVADKITTNTVEINTTKKMVEVKADQSEVDNVKGTVNQVNAEQKTMADQINQKVSSVEYQTLKDKVNNLQVGGDNLISDGDASAFNATPWGNTNFGKHEFYYNGTKNMFVIATSAKTELTSGSNWFPVKAGQQYTLYFNGFMSTNVSSYDVWLLGKAADKDGGWTNSFNVIGGERLSPSRNCIITRTFTVPNDWNNFVAYLRFDNNGSADGQNAVFFFNEISLKEGNVNTGYSVSPNDTIASIQKNATAIDENSKLISLMAKQTEVDNVKNTAQQISSRLDILAGEVKSKVDETRVNNIVDGKGYATTSTVQSLVDQKAGTINESITNLDAKYRDINGVNLVHNSGFHNVTIEELKNSGWNFNDGIWINKTGGPNKNGSIVLDYRNGTQGVLDMTQTLQLEPDTDYTLSLHVLFAEMAAGKTFDAWTFLVEKDGQGNNVNPYVDNGHPMANNYDRDQNTRTFHTTKNTHSGILYLRASPGTKVELEEVKLERGKVESNTAWTPAPSDNATVTQLQSVTASIDGLQSRVTNYQNDTTSKYTQLSNLMQSKVGTADFDNLKRAVDMQTLDSADINNMRTNGHYFVRNLANSPIAGWVYVDVTGNGNDRIRQDVYQDGGNQHKYRRWFGTYWTGWDEGATYTEITQLQDAVNLRVQKGELLSQINLTAGNTLIQSNKLYLDASSVVFSGRAFIPNAAIASLSADKVNTGWLNTNNVNLGDGRTRIRADHDYMYIQPTGSAASNTGIRMGYSGLDFLTNVIPNGYNSSVPYYSIGYDGASNGYLRISAFDHINPGGATATQNWYTMVDAISLTNSEINFATKGNMHMQIVNGGVNIKPTLFFQNNTNNGTYAGFTRLDNSDTVEFNTGNNNGENFHVNSGARFMQYVYINGYARAQGWLTNSTLSKKTNIRKLDQQVALDKIRQDDQYLYEYKRNVAQGIYDPQASFIIDDVNDVSHYSVPREFIDQSGNYREPNVELAYLIAAFQAIDKQVQLQQAEIKELKEKLQHE